MIPKGFLPEQDTGFIFCAVQARLDTSFPAMAKIENQVARIVMRDPAVAHVVGFALVVSGDDPFAVALIEPHRLVVVLDVAALAVQRDAFAVLAQHHDGIGGAGQGCVAAWSIAIDTAVVNDDHGAVEGFADGVGGADVGGHIFVAAFRADERAVEGIEYDGDG